MLRASGEIANLGPKSRILILKLVVSHFDPIVESINRNVYSREYELSQSGMQDETVFIITTKVKNLTPLSLFR